MHVLNSFKKITNNLIMSAIRWKRGGVKALADMSTKNASLFFTCSLTSSPVKGGEVYSSQPVDRLKSKNVKNYYCRSFAQERMEE